MASETRRTNYVDAFRRLVDLAWGVCRETRVRFFWWFVSGFFFLRGQQSLAVRKNCGVCLYYWYNSADGTLPPRCWRNYLIRVYVLYAHLSFVSCLRRLISSSYDVLFVLFCFLRYPSTRTGFGACVGLSFAVFLRMGITYPPPSSSSPPLPPHAFPPIIFPPFLTWCKQCLPGR